MSLKFLSKKSWNVTNLNNVEKVWIAEQEAAKEAKKLQELQKQINEERQIQELRELQVKSGQAVKTVDTTLDWMYEGPAAQTDQSAEEYLLGKIYKPKDTGENAVKETSKKPGSLWMNKISSKNDMFTRLHEDPMLKIKKNEKEARENVVNNPVKMARIRQQLAKDVEKIEAKKKRKEEKKLEKKKRKKEEKDREPVRNRSREGRRGASSTSRSRSRDRRRDRDSERGRYDIDAQYKREKSRSRSRDRRHGRSRRDNEDGMSRSRREYDEDELADGGGYDRVQFKKRRRSSSPRRSRSRSDSRRRHRQSSRRPTSQSRSRSRSPQRTRAKRPDANVDDVKDKKFGLLKPGSSGNRDKKRDGDYLGPSKELLQNKVHKEKEEARSRQAAVNRARSGQNRKLTDEEKAQKLAEMERDANVNDQMRLKRQLEKRNTGAGGVSVGSHDTGAEEVGSASKGEFLTSMRNTVYNSSQSASLSETMSRNKHYQQKGDDLDSHGFMKR